MKFKAKKNKQEFYLLFKCYWGWHNLHLSSGRPLFSKKKGSLTRKELCPLPFPSLYVKYTSTN